MSLFVVRIEGGYYEPMKARAWIFALKWVPIFGLRVGRRLYVYDRIMRRHGIWPIRTHRL